MKYNKTTRRMFLQGSGGTLLSLPFFTSLVPREARGADTGPIKRYISIATNLNMGHNKVWFPTVNELPNKLTIPGSPQKAGYQRLTDFLKDGRPGLSKVITSAMNPFLDMAMLYKSLDVVSFGFHSMTHHLGSTYWDNATPPLVQTIDNFLARNPKFDPSKRSTLNFANGGVGGGIDRNALGTLFYKGPMAGTAIDAYRMIFNNGAYPEAGGGGAVHPRRDLLSLVLEDYKRIANGRQIGSTDKIVLESVMDSMSDLQAGLSAQVSAMCKHVGQDTTAAQNKFEFLLDDAASYQNYIKLIKSVFLCDMTRVVNFGIQIPNSYDRSGGNDYHAGETHAEYTQDRIDYMSSMYTKTMNAFIAPLLTELNGCIDPANGKSFLHNGLAHITMETVYTHRNVNVPTLTVGSFNGALPTGYMVDYGDHNRLFSFIGGAVNGTCTDEPTDPLFSYDYPGIPYNRFLVTILQALGFAPADYERPELNTKLLNRTDSLYGEQNNGITHVGGYGKPSMDEHPDGDVHHAWRLSRYNFHYFKDPIPLPPKV